MEKYFYLKGQNQKGPFTAEELALEKLEKDTLIWIESLGSWKKLEDVPDLINIFKNGEETNNSKGLTMKGWFISWFGLHSLVLLMSYVGIDFINRSGFRTGKFWPFVDFQECSDRYYFNVKLKEKNCRFEGIFADYDWTEFIFYVGVPILIYLIMRNLKK